MPKAKPNKEKKIDLSKCRQWEKDRRDKLNESFNKLGKLLPSYEPSLNLSKLEILTKAASYIEELQSKVKAALTGDASNKPEQAEIKQLYLRIKQLLNRNEQLTNLLKHASITIPSGLDDIQDCKPKKWEQKISPEKAAVIAKEEAQKENEPEKPPNAPKPKKKLIKLKAISKNRLSKNLKRNAKLIRSNGNNLKLHPSIVTVTNVQPCYFITNSVTTALTTVTKAQTVVTNSNLLSAPILSTTVKTSPVVTQSKTIPSRTIIFANNLPVVQPPTIINPSIILNAPPRNTLIVVKNNANVSTVNTSSVLSKTINSGIKTIAPKPHITKTTHVNKVPIPASRYASNYILLSNVPSSLSKVKPKKKIVKKLKRVEKAPADKLPTKEPAKDPTLETNDNTDEITTAIDDKQNADSKNSKSSDYSIDALCKDKELIDDVRIPPIDENNLENQEKSKLTITEASAPAIENLKEAEKELPTPILEETPLQEPITSSENEKSREVIANKTLDVLANPLEHSELSNDIFASLQVPSGGQNPESTSPTAAFLNAFPLVSSFTGVKVTEVIEEETTDSPHGTPTLLQIGTIETSKPTQTLTDNLTPSLLNLDNFSFFSSKEMCNTLYNSYDIVTSTNSTTVNKPSKDINVLTKTAKILYDNAISDTECIKQCQEEIKTSSAISTSIVTNITKSHSEKKTQQSIIYTSYSQTYYDNNQMVNAPIVPVSTAVDSFMSDANKIKPADDKNTCNRYSTYNSSEYNTFNPFTDIPKTTTCSYVPMKNYNQPVYTNNNCNYNYQPDFNTNYSSKNSKPDKYYGMNYENYDANNQYNYYNVTTPQIKQSEKTKPSDSVPRPPINWMTAPDLKQQNADFVVPQFSKESEFAYTQNSFVSNSQTSYFNTSAPIYSSTEFHNAYSEGKKLDSQFNNSFQRNDMEEHQFTWSPTKLPQLIDPSHSFVSTSLPTLVGDLALGTNSQYLDKARVKNKERRVNQNNYDGTSNFLSVSQLVDHNKPETARITSRRNSGGRSKTSTAKTCKRVNKADSKDVIINQNFSNNNHNNKVNEKSQVKHMEIGFNEPPNEWIPETKRIKNPPSSYSAEALIGHPTQTGNQTNKQRTQHQSFSKTLPVPSFLPDNIITYFPPVDLPQEPATFTQQNQNFQNNTFTHSFSTSIQNNTYTGTFIPNPTTSYLPSTSFMPEIGDYNPIITDNIFSHSNTKCSDNKTFKNQSKPPNNKQNVHNTAAKKARKKSMNDNNTPGFVDFSFLSMPGTINSPILPDDFHSHTNFLPPPPNPNQLYSCKNPLYPKQGADLAGGLLPLPVTRTNIQHPEISPSLNTVGSSLTNFNLSTIFPEINKSTDVYLDSTKSKDYSLQRSYLSVTTQIPFSKSPIYNSITTQSFTNS